MSESERIKFIILALAAGNQRAFAKETGIHPSSVNKIVKGRFHIEKYFDRIMNAYPQLNPDWLLNGVGEPMANKVNKDDLMTTLGELGKKMDRIIELLEKVAKIGQN